MVGEETPLQSALHPLYPARVYCTSQGGQKSTLSELHSLPDRYSRACIYLSKNILTLELLGRESFQPGRIINEGSQRKRALTNEIFF